MRAPSPSTPVSAVSAPNPTQRPGRAARCLLAVLRFYRVGVSPLRPACCRYSPTCSAYAVEAIELHGPWRGTYFAARRLLRCHPFHAGGHDPVPSRVERSGAPSVLRRASETAA